MSLGYREIAAHLRDQIERGEIPPGSTLPKLEELMSTYGVARQTARSAIAELAHLGLVTPIRKRGTIVRRRRTLTYWASRSEASDRRSSGSADAYATDVVEAGRSPSQSFERHIVPASLDIARRLCIEPGVDVVLRRCLRSVDEEPWSIQDTYYPLDIIELLPELKAPTDIARGTTTALQEVGVVQVGFLDEIAARMPTTDEALFLDLSRGVPVLVQTRTGYTADRPVRVTTTVFAADRNLVVYELGDLSATYADEARR